MKPENRSIFVGIGKRINLVMIFFALVAISCGGGGGGSPTENPTGTPDDQTPLVCDKNTLEDMALSWDISPDASLQCILITPGGDGSMNGINWDNAYSVQKLRNIATDNVIDPSTDKVYLYLLKKGTYTPTNDTNRNISFTMRNNVAIIGGFSGNGFEREGITILSGDINGNNTNNSYHVINNNDNGLDSSALLAHVTVSKGYADGASPNDKGGGMYNYNSSPTIYAVTFSENKSKRHGAGMYNNNSPLNIIKSTFSNNTSRYGNGGGMGNQDSSPTVTAVTFSNNSANNGGGMCNISSSPTITASTFSNNSASNGGGMSNIDSSPTITASTFSNNTVSGDGGGMYNSRSTPTVVSSTFYKNNANQTGGAVYIDNDGMNRVVTLVNSLLWGNTAGEEANQVHLYTDGSGNEVLIVRHSVLEGDVEGVTNADTVAERKIFEEGIEVNDPLLSDLADNGGPVQTHEILPDSSAIDNGVKTGWTTDRKLCFSDGAGGWLRADDEDDTATTRCNDVTDVTTDARGYTFSGQPDIGAYELGGSPPPTP